MRKGLARALGTDETLDPDPMEALLCWFVEGTEDLHHRIGVIGRGSTCRPERARRRSCWVSSGGTRFVDKHICR